MLGKLSKESEPSKSWSFDGNIIFHGYVSQEFNVQVYQQWWIIMGYVWVNQLWVQLYLLCWLWYSKTFQPCVGLSICCQNLDLTHFLTHLMCYMCWHLTCPMNIVVFSHDHGGASGFWPIWNMGFNRIISQNTAARVCNQKLQAFIMVCFKHGVATHPQN